MASITIPSPLNYNLPVDGYVQLPFTPGPQEKGVAISTTTSSTDLNITGSILYTDGHTEVSVPLVPSLRPFHSAALHTVGRSFVDNITLADKRVKRFL